MRGHGVPYPYGKRLFARARAPSWEWYYRRMISEAAIWKKLRAICIRLPGAVEGLSFGHPTFRVEKKIFLVMEEYKGELGICLKVGKLLHGVFLEDSRFFSTPYVGRHGWVTLRVRAARLNWNEIRELVKGSYDLVATKTSAAKNSTQKRGGRSRAIG